MHTWNALSFAVHDHMRFFYRRPMSSLALFVYLPGLVTFVVFLRCFCVFAVLLDVSEHGISSEVVIACFLFFPSNLLKQ